MSIWVVPADRDHGVLARREGRVLRPGGRQALPAPDVLRGARGGEAPVSDAADLRAAARRRRARARPAAERVVRARARARGGPRAHEHRARPPRPGPRAARPRRRAGGRGPRRGRPRLPARRPRVPQRAHRRAAQRRLRPHDRAPAPVLDLPARALRPPAATPPTRSSPASPPRRSRRSRTTATTRASGRCASGDGTEESQRRMQEGDRLDVAAAAELFEHDALTERLVAEGIAVDARELRPAWEHYVGARARRGDARPSRRRRARRPAGARRRHGEAFGHMLAVMQSVAPRVPGGDVVRTGRRAARAWSPRSRTRRSPCSRSRTSGSCAASRRRRRAPASHAHADVLRLPGDRPDPRRGRVARDGRGLRRRRGRACSSSRRGRRAG